MAGSIIGGKKHGLKGNIIGSIIGGVSGAVPSTVASHFIKKEERKRIVDYFKRQKNWEKMRQSFIEGQHEYKIT